MCNATCMDMCIFCIHMSDVKLSVASNDHLSIGTCQVTEVLKFCLKRAFIGRRIKIILWDTKNVASDCFKTNNKHSSSHRFIRCATRWLYHHHHHMYIYHHARSATYVFIHVFACLSRSNTTVFFEKKTDFDEFLFCENVSRYSDNVYIRVTSI